jgi:hypothetical protein
MGEFQEPLDRKDLGSKKAKIAIGAYNCTIIATEGLGGSVQDTVIVRVMVSRWGTYPPSFVFVEKAIDKAWDKIKNEIQKRIASFGNIQVTPRDIQNTGPSEIWRPMPQGMPASDGSLSLSLSLITHIFSIIVKDTFPSNYFFPIVHGFNFSTLVRCLDRDDGSIAKMEVLVRKF